MKYEFGRNCERGKHICLASQELSSHANNSMKKNKENACILALAGSFRNRLAAQSAQKTITNFVLMNCHVIEAKIEWLEKCHELSKPMRL